MTNTEFDIVDELYFVTSFKELEKALHIPEMELKTSLEKLVQQNFVKCLFPDPDSEIDFEAAGFEQNFRQYYFLATKAGLLQHNSR